MSSGPSTGIHPIDALRNSGISTQVMWPTRFFVRLWPEYQNQFESLKKHLYELKSQSTETIASGIAVKAKASAGIYESDFDLFKSDHPALKKLHHFIVDSIRKVVAGLNGNQVPEDHIRVNVSDAWFHITNHGGFHDTHGHANCSWCGIFYVQTGDSMKPSHQGAPNGGNRFYSPVNVAGLHIDLGSQYMNACYVDPPIQDGMLLLFPSFLMHSALPYHGEKDRVVIAFNSQSIEKK